MNRIVRALESPRAARLLLNSYPPYLMTGIRVLEVSPDWRLVTVRVWDRAAHIDLLRPGRGS